MDRKWAPYVDESTSGTTLELPGFFDEVVRATVALCTKMASIRKALYVSPYIISTGSWPCSDRFLRYNSPQQDPPDLRKLYAFATKARNELSEWVSDLPAVLAVDTTKLDCKIPPHVLHLQYVRQILNFEASVLTSM